MRYAQALAIGFLGSWTACSSNEAPLAVDARLDAPLAFDAAVAVDAPLGVDAPRSPDAPLVFDAPTCLEDARPRTDATLAIGCGPPPVNCHVVVTDAAACPSAEVFCGSMGPCVDQIFICCACAGSQLIQFTRIECHTPCDAGVRCVVR